MPDRGDALVCDVADDELGEELARHDVAIWKYVHPRAKSEAARLVLRGSRASAEEFDELVGRE